eukprot:gnl/TRDRNA2_/TRDRNA2_196113_c0_seq1.p1 gnl/TRDRNA2_/TRDRNA2_196113_c0~~gnl/TRDRNA2_/TRDRNA2_196113_c0_seq1.p1  ORF type:complete len:502 (+),score=96.00 gnl/TRDRNA2_/TRDRNA2_196113_c0_seq1:22-1527(+)
MRKWCCMCSTCSSILALMGNEHSCCMILLFALSLVTQVHAHAKDVRHMLGAQGGKHNINDAFALNIVEELSGRAIRAFAGDRTGPDKTTLGKASNAAISRPRLSSLSSFPSQSLSNSRLSRQSAQVPMRGRVQSFRTVADQQAVQPEDGKERAEDTARPASDNAAQVVEALFNFLSHDRKLVLNAIKARQERLTVEQSKCQVMELAELKRELEALRISTESFSEKADFVRSLAAARVDSMKATGDTATSRSTAKESTSQEQRQMQATIDDVNTSPPLTAAAGESSEEPVHERSANGAKANDVQVAPSSATELSREERLEMERAKCKSMRVSELKKELESLGITLVAFEKNEFADALAVARVDGVTAPPSQESTAEHVEAEVVSPDGGASAPGANPFSGAGASGGNPFTGFGGTQGFPGLEDMMKNMGGMGGGSGFGGGADVLSMMQKMMSDPRVQELAVKAQSNPRIMAAVTECMTNPGAFAKYANDPDVSEFVKEMQKFM